MRYLLLVYLLIFYIYKDVVSDCVAHILATHVSFYYNIGVSNILIHVLSVEVEDCLGPNPLLHQ